MENVTKLIYLALKRKLSTDHFLQQLCKDMLFLFIYSKVGVTDLFFLKNKKNITFLAFQNLKFNAIPRITS